MVAVLATSCLDKTPGSAIPVDKAMQTFDDAEQHLTGIYAQMKSSALWSGYLTLLPDIQTDLAYAVEGYSNNMGEFWLWTFRGTSKEIEAVYGGLYSIISECNFFLEKIDQVIAKETDDDNLLALDFYKGEVYTIRALCYSELIKCYCEAYDPDNADNQLGVVLRKSYSKKERAVRASLKASYKMVLDDLSMAESLLDDDYDGYSSDYAIQGMAYALHARVALYMQDWDAAIEYSSKVIDHPHKAFALSEANVNYTNTNPNSYHIYNQTTGSQSYFQYMWSNDLATEIIWQIGFTPTSYGGALGQSFLAFNTDYVYYYPDYVPAQWVLNLYQSADLRYDAYFATMQTGHSHGLVWPLLIKYYGNESFMNSYQLFHVNSPKPFRLAEQYLIRAEAYCRKDNPNYAAASADLSTLRESRFANGVGSTVVNKDNFLQTISDERVRELYMEGHRLQDLKRWGKLLNNGVFERTPQQNSLKEGSSIKISVDNPRFVWPIPKHELDAPGSEVAPNPSNN